MMDFSKEKHLVQIRESIWLLKGPVDLPLPTSVTSAKCSRELRTKFSDIFPSIRSEQQKKASSSTQ